MKIKQIDINDCYETVDVHSNISHLSVRMAVTVLIDKVNEIIEYLNKKDGNFE